jgi:hypothetical protein
MPSAEPPSDCPALIRRPGCWIAFLIVISLLVGTAFCLENWLGARALARAKTKVAAAGLEIDPQRLPSIRPPDAENFCATPLLLDTGTGTGAPRSQVLKELEERSARWRHLPHAHDVDVQSPFTPAPTDWTRVRDALATDDSRLGLIKGSPAPLAELAAYLDKELGAVFAELSAALPRPRSVLVPTLREKFRDEQYSSTVAGNHLGSMNSLALALSFQALTDLATGRGPRAAEIIRIMLRLAEGAEAEGLYVHLYAGNSLRFTALQTTWVAALTPHALPADDWLRLAATYRLPPSLDRVREMVQFEMMASVLDDSVRRQDVEQLAADIDWGLHPGSTFFSRGPKTRLHWQGPLVPLIPSGWLDFNLATTLEGTLALLERVTDPHQPQRFSVYANSDWSKTWLAPRSALGHGIFARSSMGSMGSFVADLARHTVLCRLAETACALEAWHAQHGAYPSTLQALVPDFLPSVPADLDGQPVRYAVDPANGRYLLWSIGADDVDDGGVEKPHPAGRPGRRPRPWSEPAGDWVWQYPR